MDSITTQWVQASGAVAGGLTRIFNPGASGSVTTLQWNDTGHNYADFYTTHLYQPDKSTCRFAVKTTASGATTGVKWMGFVDTAFQNAVALTCSGAGRWNFIVQNNVGGTINSSTLPLSLQDQPYSSGAGGYNSSYNYHTYEIWWKTNTASGAQLWIDNHQRGIITTQIPSGANGLPIFFGNQ